MMQGWSFTTGGPYRQTPAQTIHQSQPTWRNLAPTGLSLQRNFRLTFASPVLCTDVTGMTPQ